MNDNELRQFIKKRIEELCAETGKSLRDLSISIDRGETYFYGIAKNRHLPTLPAVRDLCDYFEVDLDDFFSTEVKSPRRAKAIARILEALLDDDELDSVLEYIKGLSPEKVKALATVINTFVEPTDKHEQNKGK